MNFQRALATAKSRGLRGKAAVSAAAGGSRVFQRGLRQAGAAGLRGAAAISAAAGMSGG